MEIIKLYVSVSRSFQRHSPQPSTPVPILTGSQRNLSSLATIAMVTPAKPQSQRRRVRSNRKRSTRSSIDNL